MSRDIILLIILAAVVTYLPRFLPILLLKNANLPLWFRKWMGYIPISIFASLIATDIFFQEDNVQFDLTSNVKLIPSLITLFVAYKTKNMIYSILAGVISIALMVWLT